MLTLLVVCLSILLLAHSIFNLYILLYSWNDPHANLLHRSPKKFLPPQLSFSLLIPARNEAEVIGETLQTMTQLNYPKHLYEVIIICRKDDFLTIKAVKNAAAAAITSNVRLLIVNNDANNKPKALNRGLKKAKHQIIAVFDAEDEPHPNILKVINTIFIKSHADVIQSGVQLMNFLSQWFSTINVLEYFFWFKSALHFYTHMGVVPLGGNTVFIKKEALESVDGWNEKMLTEDADLGIRLSIAGAKIQIVYDEKHVTQEETPATIGQFIKQRTRWNQGFLQIFLEFEWLKLPGLEKKLFTGYILLMPIIQAIWTLYLPLTFIAIFYLTMPVSWAIISLLPAYVLFFQFVLYNYGIYEFSKKYNYGYSPLIILILLFTFFPYQLLLATAAGRAVLRLLLGNIGWEKTQHLNVHRNKNYEV